MSQGPQKSQDHSRMERTALAIFSDMPSRGYTPRDQAQEAFRRAKAFLEISDAVQSGELDPGPTEEPKREKIRVPRWIQNNEGQWNPMKDAHGQTLTEEVMTDPYAYCPNLPADHPVNVKFRPQDGVSFKERQARFQADIAERSAPPVSAN